MVNDVVPDATGGSPPYLTSALGCPRRGVRTPHGAWPYTSPLLRRAVFLSPGPIFVGRPHCSWVRIGSNKTPILWGPNIVLLGGSPAKSQHYCSGGSAAASSKKPTKPPTADAAGRVESRRDIADQWRCGLRSWRGLRRWSAVGLAASIVGSARLDREGAAGQAAGLAEESCWRAWRRNWAGLGGPPNYERTFYPWFSLVVSHKRTPFIPNGKHSRRAPAALRHPGGPGVLEGGLVELCDRGADADGGGQGH